MSSDNLQIHLDDFDGPLELLLHLIHQSKMDIYDINIKDITEQYFDYLNQMKQLNFDVAGDFFVMAANLMRIKSKMLLAKETDDDEDEDPRDDLVGQLIEYKRFKWASQKLRVKEKERTQYHFRDRSFNKSDVMIGANEFEVSLLEHAWDKIMRRRHLSLAPQIEEVQDWDFSVNEQSEIIRRKLDSAVDYEMPFSKLLNGNYPLEELVTDFLALLEMVKHQSVRVVQTSNDGEILIRKWN